jgi:hypothetical protein
LSFFICKNERGEQKEQILRKVSLTNELKLVTLRKLNGKYFYMGNHLATNLQAGSYSVAMVAFKRLFLEVF